MRSASTNLIANFIPSQYSLINFAPSKLNPTSSGIIIGIIAFFVGALWVPILSQIGVLSIVDTVGSFFGPIFGIIVADYYLIKKKENNKIKIYFLQVKLVLIIFQVDGILKQSIHCLLLLFFLLQLFGILILDFYNLIHG